MVMYDEFEGNMALIALFQQKLEILSDLQGIQIDFAQKNAIVYGKLF